MNALAKNRRLAALLAGILSICLLLCACSTGTTGNSVSSEYNAIVDATTSEPTAAAPTTTTTLPEAPAHWGGAETDAAYLSSFFDISLSGDVTAKSFTEALAATGAEIEPASGTDALAFLDAVQYAVAAAGMEELALVYTPETIEAVLSDAGLDAQAVSEDAAPYLACALESGLLDPATAALAAENAAIDTGTANSLLMSVASVNGNARTILGYTTDADIAEKLQNAWETFEILEDDVLLNVGTQLVMDKVTTGFNLLKSDYDARFLPETSLRYSHSSIEHAQQLVALLASLGVNACVQLEPKTSIYEYLPEWGEPGDPSDTYRVETVNDSLMLAYASEYDLVLEFTSAEEKANFDGIINTYAKKNTGEEDKPLLRDSWWQPLYVSHTEMGDGYQMIYDNVMANGQYSLHPFSLPDNKDAVAEAVTGIDPSVKVESVSIWVNDAFYRYLNGESE